MGEAEILFKTARGVNHQIIDPTGINVYWDGGKSSLKDDTLYRIRIIEDFDECLIMEIYEYE